MSDHLQDDPAAQLDSANQRIAELEAELAQRTDQPSEQAAPVAQDDAGHWQLDPELGPTIHGVPMILLDNPFGGQGIGILVGLDLESSHEVGQKRLVPGSDPPEYEPVPKSGGAALYHDLTTGKGWSVPLNPEGD